MHHKLFVGRAPPGTARGVYSARPDLLAGLHASIAPGRGASASVIQVCSLQPMSLAVMVGADMVMLCGQYGRTPCDHSLTHELERKRRMLLVNNAVL